MKFISILTLGILTSVVPMCAMQQTEQRPYIPRFAGFELEGFGSSQTLWIRHNLVDKDEKIVGHLMITGFIGHNGLNEFIAIGDSVDQSGKLNPQKIGPEQAKKLFNNTLKYLDGKPLYKKELMKLLTQVQDEETDQKKAAALKQTSDAALALNMLTYDLMMDWTKPTHDISIHEIVVQKYRLSKELNPKEERYMNAVVQHMGKNDMDCTIPSSHMDVFNPVIKKQ